MTEDYENFEVNKKEQLIHQLLTKGIENSESKRLLNEWLEEKEREIQKNRTPTAEIEFEIERADVYTRAGFHDFGEETLRVALYMAEQETLPELVTKIEKLLRGFE